MYATSRREIFLRVVPIFVVWLAIFGSRPFQLGFCCEDWVIAGEATHHGGAFSIERFRWHLMVDSSRPVAATVRFLMSSLSGDSTFLWHTLAALMSLAVAFSVFAFARALLRLWGAEDDWGATVGAVIWLCLPWTMGATAFLSLVPMLCSTICFAASGVATFKLWREQRVGWLWAGVFYLIGNLAYENYYAQFVTLLVIGVALGVHRVSNWRVLLSPIAAMLGAQIIAFGFNRIHNLAVRPTLSVGDDWLYQFARSIVKLPWAMLMGAQGFRILTAILAMVVIVLLSIAVLRQWRTSASRRQVVRALGIFAALAVGTMISLLLYSLVDYYLTGIGLFSRTMVAMSFLFTIGCGVAFAIVATETVWLRAVTLFVAGLFALTLATATFRRQRDWRETWQQQQQILSAAPVEKMLAARSDAVILYAGPLEHNSVKIFEGWWDLTAAMNHQFPALRLRHSNGTETLREFSPLDFKWLTTWDGKRLEQEFLTGRTRTRETSEVWVWRADTGQLFRIKPPFRFGRPTWIRPPSPPQGELAE
jgi:hypothetical protein